jgi:signal recognition particle receptor subunit beta
MKFVDDTLYVKLVFFGAAMAGKTEVIKCLYNKTFTAREKTGAGLRQLNTTAGRTLLFDFTTVKLDRNVIARLFSVSGQNYYQGARLHSMQDTDAVFLVIDAQKSALERNEKACEELRWYKRSISSMRNAPVIALINKLELCNTLPILSLVRRLGLQKDNWPFIAVNPIDGDGQNIGRGFKMMQNMLWPAIVDSRRDRDREERARVKESAASRTAAVSKADWWRTTGSGRA